MQVNEERESGRDHENIDLKHGQIDPQNMPHVGGGNWAGGVGKSIFTCRFKKIISYEDF